MKYSALIRKVNMSIINTLNVVLEDTSALTELGTRVRAWRALRGMTRKQLAVDSGLSERFLADMEAGRGNASLTTLQSVAQALNITTLDLLQDTPRPALSRVLALVNRLDDAQLDAAYTALGAALGNQLGLPSPQGRDNRVALLGLRGAGKSTLGAQLAAQQNVPFIELDREIEREAGTSMQEIILLQGQAGYRRYERRALLRIAQQHADGVVLTTGGSIVSERETFDLLQSHFFCVWVKASPEEHMGRVVAQGDMRPFITSDVASDSTPDNAADAIAQGKLAGANAQALDDIRRILDSRQQLYARSDAVVDTSARTVRQSLKDLQRAISATATA
jgi:XRE family transcriptional regulator, aerobic/anaerobic benzoate catabolism transcriptional regulator